MEGVRRDIREQPLAALAVVHAVFLDDLVPDLAAVHAVDDLLDRIDPGNVPEIVLRIVNAKRRAVHQQAVAVLAADARRCDPDILDGATFQNPAEMHFRRGLVTHAFRVNVMQRAVP